MARSSTSSPSSLAPIQAELPRLGPRGARHLRGCGCPRCRGWVADGARQGDDVAGVQARAEAALARRRERRRARALALQLELADGERQTERFLRRQSEITERLKADPRLEVLLAARDAGVPITEAIAGVERRFGGRSRGT
jgi:hypothetical protein